MLSARMMNTSLAPYINKRGQVKEGTKVVELRKLAETNTDFTEKDILNRHKMILDAFIDYLRDNDLAK